MADTTPPRGLRFAVVTDLAWASLPARLASMAGKMSALLGFPLALETVPCAHGPVPVAADGRVERAWLKAVLAAAAWPGYDGAILLFERRQLANPKAYRLGLRGFFIRDGGFLEAFVCATETGKGKSHFGRYQADRTIAHELLHGLYDAAGCGVTPDEAAAIPGKDNTHYHDKKKRRIEDGYREVGPLLRARLEPVPSDPKLAGLRPAAARAAAALVAECARLKRPIKITEGLRTGARQAQLYAQGRTAPGKIVTRANVGQSDHEYGVAIDVCFAGKTVAEMYPIDPAAWRWLWGVAARCGFDDWGGLWPPLDAAGLGWDKPHLAVTKGKSWVQFSKKGFDWTPWL